ncbi:MAG TPA: RNA polymerase sigma factor [Solirubrobacteraceae bacterium]|nr:RNA polymerase sigma factor [Solirubrobacteraceae bacterium]
MDPWSAGDVGGLVLASRRGDRQATEALAARALRLAGGTAAAILRSRDRAGDVAQDVAVEVLSSLDRLRAPAAFDAWVHRIAVRRALKAAARHRREGQAGSSLSLLDEPREPVAAQAGGALAVATRVALADALAELPARQRAALALRYVHDLSDEQIAAALGCRRGTVHALLSRGRAALRTDQRLLAIVDDWEEEPRCAVS